MFLFIKKTAKQFQDGHLAAAPPRTFFPSIFGIKLFLWAPWAVAIRLFCFGKLPTCVAAMSSWAAIFGNAAIAIASSCQCSKAAATSGIAVLSPALFTLVTVQHLELTPGMSYRQRSSQRKWTGRLSEQTNTVFTLPSISINSMVDRLIV